MVKVAILTLINNGSGCRKPQAIFEMLKKYKVQSFKQRKLAGFLH
ncbi:MAG: hypothetical protein ACJA08_000742 [Cyclobacteriaceae bacterium]|jgi:hypothetical protein